MPHEQLDFLNAHGHSLFRLFKWTTSKFFGTGSCFDIWPRTVKYLGFFCTRLTTNRGELSKSQHFLKLLSDFNDDYNKYYAQKQNQE